MTPFWATHKRSRFRHSKTGAYCTSWHAQFTCNHILPIFACGGCIQGAYRILVNPTSGGSRPLGGIPTNLYLSVSTVTVPSWRRGFLSWCVEYVSSEHYCQLKFSVHDIPPSPEMTVIATDHDPNIYIEWHNIRKKHQSLLHSKVLHPSSYTFHVLWKADKQEQKFFSEKQRGFRDDLSYSTLQKS